MRNQFPTADELRTALLDATRKEREILARLWLSEGPPEIFRRCPAVYDELRGWLSARLRIHAKEITIVGSARTGYSMVPRHFGRPFGQDSDLDLAIISDSLFERLTTDFYLFADDYRSGTVRPRSEKQSHLWQENLKFGNRNIPNGFFDAWKIPNFSRYTVTREINQAMWKLVNKLERTETAPRVRRASGRVYRDWKSFVARVELNLSAALRV